MSNQASRPEAWFRKAADDLLSIANNLATERVPRDHVCFAAQQAAEKYLKGFIVSRGLRPPKIHDLVALLALCAASAPELASLEEDCRRLSPPWLDVALPGYAGHRRGRGTAGARDRHPYLRRDQTARALVVMSTEFEVPEPIICSPFEAAGTIVFLNEARRAYL